MCPEAITLSVYCDNELPETVSAEVRAHLAHCTVCRMTVEMFKSQRRFLLIDQNEDPLAHQDLDSFWRFAVPERMKKRGTSRLSVPLPLAISVSAVLFVIMVLQVLSLTRMNLWNSVVLRRRSEQSVPPVISITVTPDEFESFLSILEAIAPDTDWQNEPAVLPVDLSAMEMGEPVMLRPSHYHRGGS